MTVSEFLRWEDGTDTRYELLGGRPVPMAPPLQAHGEIVAALSAEIRSRLTAPCRIAVESGVKLPGREDTFYMADIAISCAQRGTGDRFVSDPLVLIEILSPSTASHDRGTKASDYRTIPSVREIALVFTTAPRVEIWRRTDEGWLIQDIVGQDAVLALPSVGIELPLRAVYEGITLEETPREPGAATG